MKKWLYALGIKNLFARTADLSHLTDQKYITVSQVSLLKLFAIWIVVTEGPCTMSYRPTIRKEPHLTSMWNLHILYSMHPSIEVCSLS